MADVVLKVSDPENYPNEQFDILFNIKEISGVKKAVLSVNTNTPREYKYYPSSGPTLVSDQQVQVPFVKESLIVGFENHSDTVDLMVSLDSGMTWGVIKPNTDKYYDVLTNSVYIKSSSPTESCLYQVVYGIQ